MVEIELNFDTMKQLRVRANLTNISNYSSTVRLKTCIYL